MIERKYFPINEELAFQARRMWSFTDYTKGSTTASYKSQVEEAYELVDKVEEEKPDQLEKALSFAERYSKKMADWYNKKHSIEMMCPSVMICGPANFPTQKKERQNARMHAHIQEFSHIESYKEKIKGILYNDEIIKSNDENVLEKLEKKLEDLTVLKEQMKEANKYYKKNGTRDGFTGIDQKMAEDRMEMVRRKIIWGTTVFSTTNINAQINATKGRIESIRKAKEAGTKETLENDICKVIENSELMRIQIVFEEKPSKEICSMLSKNGFKWSPRNGAWQRQLTNNGKWVAKEVVSKLKEMKTA